MFSRSTTFIIKYHLTNQIKTTGYTLTNHITLPGLYNYMKLSVWGGEESYSISLKQEEKDSGGKGRQRGQGRGRCESRVMIFV